MNDSATLLDAINWYEAVIVPTKVGAREERTVLKVIRTFCVDFLDLPLALVEPKHVGLFRQRRATTPVVRRLRNGACASTGAPASERTIYKDLCVLSSVFRTFCTAHLLPHVRNPVTQGMRPRPPTSNARAPVLSAEDIRDILFEARRYDRGGDVPMELILKLALTVPLSLEELAALRWESLCIDRRLITIGYGPNARSVRLPAQLVPDLRSHATLHSGRQSGAGSLWGNSNPASIRTAWNRIKRRAQATDVCLDRIRQHAITMMFVGAKAAGMSESEVGAACGLTSALARERYIKAAAQLRNPKAGRTRQNKGTEGLLEAH